jgi:hypothetical protein
MRSGAWLLASLVACGSAANVGAPAQAPSSSTAAPLTSSAPAPPLDLEAGAALELLPDEGEILVRTDVLRHHPVGARLGPILGTWPGWRSTLHAVARDPVADLDWIDVVAPSDSRQGRLLARAAEGASDAALDGRLVALQARSAEPAAGHVVAGLTAAAARLDGSLRVVFRAQPRFVAATPASRGVAISAVLVRARIPVPSTAPFEAVRADVPEPHELVRAVPPLIHRMQAHVFALANGDADASADGECTSADDARRAAAALEETIGRQNFSIVRMVTHGILDGITVRVDGTTVRLHLHASRDQLDAVLGLASAMLPPADP